MSVLLCPHYSVGGPPAAGVVAIGDATVAGPYYAYFTLGFDGFTYHQSTAGAAVQHAAWISPQVGMNLYECEATPIDGLAGGTYGSWLDLANSWTWGFHSSRYSSGASATLQIQIRRKSDLVVVATFNVHLDTAGGL